MKNRQAGFTLIELMVVVVILALLAGLIMPRFLGQSDTAKQQAARTQMALLESALKMYKPTTVLTRQPSRASRRLLRRSRCAGNLAEELAKGGYLIKESSQGSMEERLCVCLSRQSRRF